MIRKSLRQTWVVFLLVLALPWQPLYAVGYDRGQWEQIFRGQIDSTLAIAYSVLGKNLSDGFIYLENDLESLSGAARVAEVQMKVITNRFAGASSGELAGLLREERQLRAAAKAMSAQLDYLDGLFTRLKVLPKESCGPAAMDRLAEDFRITGLLQVKSNLEQINAQIKNVQEHGVGSGFQVTVSAPMGGGSSPSSSPGGGGGVYTRPDPQTPYSPNAGGTRTWYDGNDTWNQLRFDVPGGYAGYSEQDKQVQSAIVGGMTALGATIGSVIPGLGTVLGGLIGSVIGGLLCAIIFGNPKSKLIGQLRDQIDVILGLVDTIAAEGIVKPAVKHCQQFMQAPELLSLAAEVGGRWPKRLSEARASLAAVAQSGEEIDRIYSEQLARLRDDVYPNLQLVIDQKFEDFYREVGKRSTESRQFAGEKLTAPLRALVGGAKTETERVAAEDALWEAIVEGDARYSATKAFSFQPSAVSEGREVLAWDGLVRAVYRRAEKGGK